MMLPDGVVTFLFTDVEGSTRLWDESPDAMTAALGLHDATIEHVAGLHGGIMVKPRGEGDSTFIVFSSARDALATAADIQRSLATIEWSTPRPIRVRIALHTGIADLRAGDYYGTAVNRAARLRAIAHGGQTLMSASTWELVRDNLPEGVSIKNMGEHVLKDLTRPEHVYQIDVVGLDDDFPPLRSLAATPNNLPTQLTGFVGREAELAEATRILGGSRLLTILAPGGAGKTRLAIQLAAEMTSDFPDGVFFVDLAPITSPDDIIQTVSESVGIALSGDEDLLVQLLAYLGRKQRLLVFDNFEHVVQGAGIVAEILRGVPAVKVIATSRTKLNVVGETVMSLSGLNSEWARPEDVMQAAGAQLFVEAASRAAASFTLSDADVEPLRRILRLVAGMPLGIELAAAWVDVLTLAEIATEIAGSLDFLETEQAGDSDRHRSIRAVFEYSWSMMSEDERLTFQQLSVFRDGFTREAAEAITGTTIRGLAALVRKSLLGSDRESGRYAVHELLRQFAETSLKDDRVAWEQAMDAHATYYADRAAHAEFLLGSSDQKKSLQIVENDLDNMRAAWRWSLARGNATLARSFLFALWFLHDIRGWHQAAVSLFGEALDAFDADSDDEGVRIVRAASSGAQGWFMIFLGHHAEGTRRAHEAVATLSPLHDLTAYVMTAQFECVGLMYLGRADRVNEMHAVSSEAIGRAEEAGDEWLAAEVKTYLAASELFMGHPETASRLIDEGEAVLRARGEYRKLSMNLLAKSLIANRAGRFSDAIEILKGVVDSAAEIGYRRMMHMGLENLGDAYLATGQLQAANDALLEGLAMSEEMGSVLEMVGLVAKIARVWVAMGRSEEAVAMLASVLADPMSRQSMLFENTSVADIATELLGDLVDELDEITFAQAEARGSTRSVEVMAKELLAPARP